MNKMKLGSVSSKDGIANRVCCKTNALRRLLGIIKLLFISLMMYFFGHSSNWKHTL